MPIMDIKAPFYSELEEIILKDASEILERVSGD
jgi:hypothetical protein